MSKGGLTNFGKQVFQWLQARLGIQSAPIVSHGVFDNCGGGIMADARPVGFGVGIGVAIEIGKRNAAAISIATPIMPLKPP
jgi:hypothetical protein